MIHMKDEERIKMGKAGYDYVMGNFTYSILAEKLAIALNLVVEKS